MDMDGSDMICSPRALEKLESLRKILLEAINLIFVKLHIIQHTISNITGIENITPETKTICSILVEVRELLKHFPELQKAEIVIAEQHGNDKFSRFRKNVQEIIVNIMARLNAVVDFIVSTDSLPKAMAVAVTVRDITKHFKGISPTDGSIHFDRLSASNPGNLKQENDVVPGRSPSVSSPQPPVTTPLPAVLVEAVEAISEKANVNQARSKRMSIMTSKEQQLMDQAVSNKMKTITKTNANLMKKLLEDETNVNKLFKEKHYPRESITQYFDHSRIFYCGTLKRNTYSIKNFGKTWKENYFVLDHEKITVYQAENSPVKKKVIFLTDIKSCSWDNKVNGKEDLASVTITDKNKKLLLQSDSPVEMVIWACIIDTVQSYKKLPHTILNPLDKHKLLCYSFKEPFKGGEIKSSYDEDWSYSADGLITSVYGIAEQYEFRWDGEMIIGTNEISRELGSGKWNGITLIWYDEQSNGMITTPTIRYDWHKTEREYHNPLDKSQVWKWTRHFLASKFGAGEWIVEGNIPEPVVMFLQIIRTCRIQRNANI